MSSIAPGQAIRNAIEAELAAARFYRLLAESTDDAESQAFLSDMAEQEQSHAKAIEDAGSEVVSTKLPQHAVGEVAVVETLPSWRYVDNLSLDDAYEIAIEAERQAALYYDAIADCFEGDTKAFFENLAKAEEEHERILLKRREASKSAD